MKIDEFRAIVRNADHAKLETIAAELYKKIPKAKKEEMDDGIQRILRGEPLSAPAEKLPNALPFPELSKAITTFLAYVDEGYYNKPNRVVPKEKRSKWRFEVMRFLKALDAAPGEEAADLYLALYKRLAYACGYYIFSTEDPFRSIGTTQADFYPRLAAKYFSNGFSDAKILEMLRAATSVYIDRDSLYEELEAAFIRELKTRDMREKAYRIAKDEVARLEALPPGKSYSGDYERERKINEICITILGLGIAIFEEDDAVAYYLKHYRERDKEVKLYVALDSIKAFGGGKELWVKVYDQAVAKGIEPRQCLVDERKEMGK